MKFQAVERYRNEGTAMDGLEDKLSRCGGRAWAGRQAHAGLLTALGMSSLRLSAVLPRKAPQN
jgi:hypothetical protein